MWKTAAALCAVISIVACEHSPTAPSRISDHVDPPGVLPAAAPATDVHSTQDHVEPPSVLRGSRPNCGDSNKSKNAVPTDRPRLAVESCRHTGGLDQGGGVGN